MKHQQATDGWTDLQQAIAQSQRKIRDAAPDKNTASEGEAYVTRVVAGLLSDGFLGHLNGTRGLSRALQIKGCPNPDYLLDSAPVSPSQTYKLSGQLNGSERVGVGLYTFTRDGVALERGYRVFDRANTEPGGVFSLMLSPAPGSVGHLAISGDARVLLVRTLHRDAKAQPASLCLSGPDGVANLALPATGNDAGLARAGEMLIRSIDQFLAWSEVCSARPNTLFTPPESMAGAVQGDPGTRYLLGYYHLAEGQTLEVTLPASSPPGLDDYWSLHAYNHWGEPLPGAGRHDRNTQAGPDGVVTLSIGPGLPCNTINGIDTCGRQRGILIFRAIGKSGATAQDAIDHTGDQAQLPSCRVLPG